MKKAIFLATLCAATVGGVAVAQLEYQPEDQFRRNPLRAIFDSVQSVGAQVQRVELSAQAAHDSIDTLAQVVSDSQTVSDTTCSGAVARVTTCTGDSCRTLKYPCHPFGCDPTGTTCSDSCTASPDCAAGALCDVRSQQCVPVSYTCATFNTVLRSDGYEYPCSPYACRAGACQSTCSSNFDCDQAESYVCRDGRCVR